VATWYRLHGSRSFMLWLTGCLETPPRISFNVAFSFPMTRKGTTFCKRPCIHPHQNQCLLHYFLNYFVLFTSNIPPLPYSFEVCVSNAIVCNVMSHCKATTLAQLFVPFKATIHGNSCSIISVVSNSEVLYRQYCVLAVCGQEGHLTWSQYCRLNLTRAHFSYWTKANSTIM